MKPKTKNLMAMLGIKDALQAKSFTPTDMQKGMLCAFEQLNPQTSLEEAFAEAINYYEKLEKGTAYEFELHQGGKAVIVRREGSGRQIFMPLDLFNYITKHPANIKLKGLV